MKSDESWFVRFQHNHWSVAAEWMYISPRSLLVFC
jgi:hypothetical protein